MTALYLNHRWKNKNIKVSLIESADIGIIGVGEGSTPSLKNFFDDIEIKESEWMPQCQATYKVGIRFDNWSTQPGFESYRHPFPSQVDKFSSDLFAKQLHIRRHGIDVEVHPDKFFIQSQLAMEKKGPIAPYHFPLENAYGYHFDSGLLGQYLAEIARLRGIGHIQAKVTDALLNNNGMISTLVTEENTQINADFFIDCTGFVGFLIQKKLQIPFISFSDNLFNDSAVVIPTPANKTINSETVSTALQHGWAWDIPLQHRTGNGYVYSSAYCDQTSAETELRKKLNLLDSDIGARHLKMKVGRVSQHWSKNCLAIGLSQGFIEPLEATALHLVQATILEFIIQFEKGNFTNQFQSQFNDTINNRFEGVRDYIVAHYRLNTRTDTQYWLDNANNPKISESLTRILQSWTGALGHDIEPEIIQQNIAGYFPVDSWRILLAGYGFFPALDHNHPQQGNIDHTEIENHQAFLKRCGVNFKTQNALLIN
ncbi:tryptophan 7-halogenase [Aliikangiella marina]|uniref:Tryptophan 7-halogenase n=2 Tax=Aliikangiella marina TaxID=1712262 RepID=A0A545TAA1_9GAMM|nr:tryptophan 7-halogenase [Aliikangiella marina]